MDEDLNSFEIKTEPLDDPDPSAVDPLAPTPSDYNALAQSAISQSNLFAYNPVKLDSGRTSQTATCPDESVIKIEIVSSDDDETSEVMTCPKESAVKIEAASSANYGTSSTGACPRDSVFKVESVLPDNEWSPETVTCLEKSVVNVDTASPGYSIEDWNNGAETFRANLMDVRCPMVEKTIPPDDLVTPALRVHQETFGFKIAGVIVSRNVLIAVVEQEQDQFACEICDYKTHREDHLKGHIESVHGGVESYSCGVGGYMLRSRSREESALFDRRAPTSYNCVTCNFKAVTLAGLVRHERCVHKDIRPYACHMCDDKFSLKHYLKRHILTVHQVKPYACDYCDYRAGAKNTMISHVRSIHQGLKPYSCEICHHKCSIRSNLKKHALAVHGIIDPFVSSKPV